MYHNSATPPLPACYDDTCQPHQHLDMLSSSFVILAKRWELWWPSEVNKFGSLITDKTWSFKAVDCSWYRIGAGKDFQRPIRIIFVTDRSAARAIVGPDILIECVLNHSSLKPKWAADDLLPLECGNSINKIDGRAHGMMKMDRHSIVKSAWTIDKSDVQTVSADVSYHG